MGVAEKSFLKRRAQQFGNCRWQSSWSLCTDLQRRRRLRRLAAEEKLAGGKDIKKYTISKKRNWKFFLYNLIPPMIILFVSFCIVMYQNGEALSMFMQRYSSQYQAIVHNKLNYCDPSMPLNDCFGRMRENVLNQEAALDQLEQALTTDNSFQSIALVGSSGVGKSLTMRMLIEQFPWAENVQSIAWNDYDLNDDDARIQAVYQMQDNLAYCGRNLIIIDNMTPYDVNYVTSINQVISHSDYGTKHVAIIYIFNLNRMLEDSLYERQLKAVKQLPGTKLIFYRQFDQDDLERCVRHEAKLAGFNIEEHYVKEIVGTADVENSGCKSVRAKVYLFSELQGKPFDCEQTE